MYTHLAYCHWLSLFELSSAPKFCYFPGFKNIIGVKNNEDNHHCFIITVSKFSKKIINSVALKVTMLFGRIIFGCKQTPLFAWLNLASPSVKGKVKKNQFRILFIKLNPAWHKSVVGHLVRFEFMERSSLR